MRKDVLARWFDEILLADILLVGGENASLRDMYQHRSSRSGARPSGNGLVVRSRR